jgi:hypothetical protein
VANGDFSGTLDVSTFLSSFLAFFTAFFSFFACFRSPFVFLDIRRGPPPAVMAAWTFQHTSQASVSSLRHRFRSIASRQDASAVAQHDQPTRILRYPAAIDGSGDGQVVMPIDDFLLGAITSDPRHSRGWSQIATPNHSDTGQFDDPTHVAGVFRTIYPRPTTGLGRQASQW